MAGDPILQDKEHIVARLGNIWLIWDVEFVFISPARRQMNTDASLVGVHRVGSGTIANQRRVCVDRTLSGDLDGVARLDRVRCHTLDHGACLGGSIGLQQIWGSVDLIVEMIGGAIPAQAATCREYGAILKQ